MEAMFRTVISLKVAAIAHRHLYQGKTGLSMVARSEAGRRRGGLGPACSGVGRERPGGGEGGAAARGGEWRSDAAGAAARGRRSPEPGDAEPGYAHTARRDSLAQPRWKPAVLAPLPQDPARPAPVKPSTTAFPPDPGSGTGHLADRRPGTHTAGTLELSVPDFLLPAPAGLQQALGFRDWLGENMRIRGDCNPTLKFLAKVQARWHLPEPEK